MRVALLTTFVAKRKEPLAEMLQRIYQAFSGAGQFVPHGGHGPCNGEKGKRDETGLGQLTLLGPQTCAPSSAGGIARCSPEDNVFRYSGPYQPSPTFPQGASGIGQLDSIQKRLAGKWPQRRFGRLGNG